MPDHPRFINHPSFAGLIGAGREDITPPVGIYARNWGAAKHDISEGIHRPLTVTVLALRSGPADPPLLLAGADLGWWRTIEDEAFVRDGLLDAFSLEPARVMVNLAHTHAGPSICREDADKPGGRLIAPYLEKVRDALIRAARAAVVSAAPATLDWAYGRCALARNRDLPDPDRDRFACGFNPDAPADDTLLVGRATADGGRPIATVVNYACHPTSLAWDNRLISPDYVGALRETVEARTAGAPCLFLLGCCGELGPREGYSGDPAVADRNGRELGYAALSTLEGMLPPRTRMEFAGIVESGAPLATWRHAAHEPSRRLEAECLRVDLPLKPLDPLAKIEGELKACADPVAAERLRRKLRVRRTVGEGTSAAVPVWVWRVGDAFIVGQPEEGYSRLQTDLRRSFPDHAVAAMNLVNGSCGYLPPRELYGRDLYQVWQTPFDGGSLERMIAACQDQIRKMA